MSAASIFGGTGFQEILLKVMEDVDCQTVTRVMRVSKGAHAILSTSIAIQVRLRKGLYGLDPIHGFEQARGTITPPSISDLSRLDAIGEFERVSQSCELGACHFHPTVDLPIACIQDRIQFYVPAHTLAVSDPKPLVPAGHLRRTEITDTIEGSRVAFCSADNVVVESHTIPMRLNGLMSRVFSFSFYDTRQESSRREANARVPRRSHPDAGYATLFIATRAFVNYSSTCNFEIRLHAGGLLSAFFAEPVPNLRPDSSLIVSRRRETHLMVIDWHKGVVLGFAKMSSAIIRMTDMQFGSKTQIVCASLRTEHGSLIPSCDLFEIAPYSAACDDGPNPELEKLILIKDCPELRHLATFELPPLFSGSRFMGPLWSGSNTPGPRVIRFTFEVSQPSPGPYRRDQIITLRIRGANEKGEKHEVQAVILVSRMFRMISDARQKQQVECGNSTDSTECQMPVVIRWARARAAVSLSTSLATAPSVSSGTRAFTICRASPSKKEVICRIEDYNPAMYRATPDQLQHLLHSSNLESSETTAAPACGYKKVPISKPSLSTHVLFPRCLAPGLSHRVMDIPLHPSIGAIADEVVGARLYMDKRGLILVTKGGEKVIAIEMSI